MLEKVSLPRTVAQIAWHLFRYAVATFVSTLALAAIPILVVSAFVFTWLLGYLLVLVGLLPIDEPMSLLIAPPLLVIFEVVAVAVILVLAAVFTVVGILPLSFLVEFAFWRLTNRRLSIGIVLARLMGFVIAGGMLGMLVGAVELLWVQLDTLAEVGLAYAGSILISVCAVFLFGLVLTLMRVVEKGFLVAWRKISRNQCASL